MYALCTHRRQIESLASLLVQFVYLCMWKLALSSGLYIIVSIVASKSTTVLNLIVGSLVNQIARIKNSLTNTDLLLASRQLN